MEDIITLCRNSKTDSKLWETALAKIVTEDFQTDGIKTDLILTHLVPTLKDWKNLGWTPKMLNDCFSFFRSLQFQREGLEVMFSDDFHLFLLNVSCGPGHVPDVFTSASRVLINLCVLNQEETLEQFSNLETWKLVLDRFSSVNSEEINFMFRILFYVSYSPGCREQVFSKIILENEEYTEMFFKRIAECMDLEQIFTNPNAIQGTSYSLKTLLNFTLVDEQYLNSEYPGLYDAINSVCVVFFTSLFDAPDFNPDSIYFGPRKNAKCNLLEIKTDVCNLLVFGKKLMGQDFLTNPAIENWDKLFEILDVSVMQYGAEDGSEPDELMIPILTVIGTTLKHNAKVALRFKEKIFSELAYSENDDPKRNYMKPILDEEPSVRNILIKWLMAVRHSVKTETGNLLYAACNQDAEEFTRCVGIGPGIGYLKDHDLFAGLMPNLNTTTNIGTN